MKFNLLSLVGITPAGAGHTAIMIYLPKRMRDHPRRCGAYQTLRDDGMKFVWITPAGAGHTTCIYASKQQNGDHPRRCGAYLIDENPSLLRPGSPPQVRGILYLLIVQLVYFRDHPRRCGAYTLSTFFSDIDSGSPPQVRGILQYQRFHSLLLRITPAGAGHTEKPSGVGEVQRDHPRRCGAYFLNNIFHLRSLGSPPQVRGILQRVISNRLVMGITPAGAGHTTLSPVSNIRRWDHPRRCGAYRTSSKR